MQSGSHSIKIFKENDSILTDQKFIVHHYGVQGPIYALESDKLIQNATYNIHIYKFFLANRNPECVINIYGIICKNKGFLLMNLDLLDKEFQSGGSHNPFIIVIRSLLGNYRSLMIRRFKVTKDKILGNKTREVREYVKVYWNPFLSDDGYVSASSAPNTPIKAIDFGKNKIQKNKEEKSQISQIEDTIYSYSTDGVIPMVYDVSPNHVLVSNSILLDDCEMQSSVSTFSNDESIYLNFEDEKQKIFEQIEDTQPIIIDENNNNTESFVSEDVKIPINLREVVSERISYDLGLEKYVLIHFRIYLFVNFMNFIFK